LLHYELNGGVFRKELGILPVYPVYGGYELNGATILYDAISLALEELEEIASSY